jgi:hypothetical protein
VLLAPNLDALEDPTARLALDDVQSPEVEARQPVAALPFKRAPPLKDAATYRS